MPTPSRARVALFWLVLVAIPLAAAVLALGVYGVVVTRPYLALDVRQTGDDDLAFDPELGFVRPPHASTRRTQTGVDYTIHTDRLGARVDAPGVETPNRVDLMTVGCSFSEGHGMANEQTYTSLVGRELGLTVANFAVGSYSGVQAALSLDRHADLHPRVVVYGLIEDHLRRNLDPCAPNFFPNCLQVPIVAGLEARAPVVTRVGPSGFDGLELTDALMKLRDDPSLVRRAWLGVRTAWHEYRDWRSRPVVAAQASMTDDNGIRGEAYAIRRMARSAQAMGATLVVLHVGRLDGLPADDPSRGWKPLPAALRAAIPPEVVFIDAVPAVAAFVREHPGERLTLTDRDDHPNARAHALFAQLIAATLRERGLAPPAATDPEPTP
jgi:hypothetical protein